MTIAFTAFLAVVTGLQAWALVLARRNTAATNSGDWTFGAPREDSRELVRIRVVVFVAVAGLLGEWWLVTGWDSIRTVPGMRDWLGLVLFGGGTGLLIASIAALGPSFSPTDRARPRNHLVTSGPYRFIRHPIYISNIIAWAGILCIYFSWMFFVVMGFHLLYLMRRIPHEEAALHRLHGTNYERYARRTGMILPRIW